MEPRALTQIGPYPVRRFVAEGGMAWVFEVVDPKLEAARALKLLKPEVQALGLLPRFEFEARILAQLDDENLVRVYDFDVDPGTGCPFYTMTLVEGETLAQRIQRAGPLPWAEAVGIFRGILAGLARLHARGIVHRDVKPSNILVRRDGTALLADVGIARAPDPTNRTATHITLGTPEYMAPEQGEPGAVSTASDVFSTGLTLYHALTGHSIYEEIEGLDSRNFHSILMYLGGLQRSRAEFGFHFSAGVPRALREVVRRSCRISPKERFTEARELRSALSLPAPAERRRGLALVGTTLLVTLSMGAGLLDAAVGPRRDLGPGPEPDESRSWAVALVESAEARSLEGLGDDLRGWRGDLVAADAVLEWAREARAHGYGEARAYEMVARDRYEEICADVNGSFLGPELRRGRHAALEELDALQESVQTLLADTSSTEVETLIPLRARLEEAREAPPHDSPCEWGRVADAALVEVERLAAEVEETRDVLLPEMRRVVESARAEAVAARRRARGAPELGPARAMLQHGDARRAEGDLAGAFAEYVNAKIAFFDAVASIPPAPKQRPAPKQPPAPKKLPLRKEPPAPRGSPGPSSDELGGAGRTTPESAAPSAPQAQDLEEEGPPLVPPEPESEESIEAALGRYESAYEACAVDDLRGTWNMSRTDETFVRFHCSRCAVEVEIEVGEISRDGDRATADVVQRIGCRESDRRVVQNLTAGLFQREDGTWSIHSFWSAERTARP